MYQLATETDRRTLRSALDTLAQRDPHIAEAIQQAGYPEPRFREQGFSTLMRIIVSQQLSTKVADAIWERVEKLIGAPFSAEALLAVDAEALRGCGLSWRKVEFSQALAQRFAGGEMSAEQLADLDEESLIKTLVSLKGFGVWSAEIYAMFALRYADIFPAGDLALQVGIQRLLRLSEKPDEKSVREISRRWRPHRAAAALMLWKYYGSTTLD